MTITMKQQAEMLEAALPLMKWMNENAHFHCTAIVQLDRIELLEATAMMITDEFLNGTPKAKELTEYEQLQAKIKSLGK